MQLPARAHEACPTPPEKSVALSVSVIHALVAQPFLENRRPINSSANSAPYLPCGLTERLHLWDIVVTTPSVQTTHVSFG